MMGNTDIEGQSASAPSEEEKAESQQTPAVEGGTQQQTQPESIPEKFQGKTAEDIAKAYQELESQYGKLASEIGKMKEENEAFRQWYNTIMLQQRGQAQPQSNPSPVAPEPAPSQVAGGAFSDEEFIEKPVEAVDKLVTQKLQQYSTAQRFEMAYRLAPFAKTTAKNQYPQLFEGINEQELDQIMYGGAQAGAIAPDLLADPNGWAGAAWQLKGRKMGFNIAPSPPSPMSPPQTESPQARKTTGGEEPVQIQEDTLAIAQAFGKSPKEAVEILKRIREERKNREVQ